MQASRRLGFQAAIVALAAAALARAETRDEAIRLDYRASDGCPDSATFMAAVHQRAARARLALPGEGARTFVVVVDAGPPASGQVTIRQDGQSQGSRHMQAESCAEVADALALVVALAVEPIGSPPPAPAPHSDPLPTVQSPAGGDSRAQSQPRQEASVKGVYFAGADFAAVTGVAPSVLLGASPFVGWLATGVSIQPSARIAFERTASGTLGVQGGDAVFTWTVGRLDACPLGGARGTLRLAACARLEAGTLEVSGRGNLGTQTQLVPWVAAGPVGRAEWSPFPVAFLDAEVAFLVRATTDRFFFLPDTTVYQVPLLGVGGGVGIGAHFL